MLYAFNEGMHIAWRRRLTRRGCARHPLFGFAGKRGLKFYYLVFYNILSRAVVVHTVYQYKTKSKRIHPVFIKNVFF
jgi:hypothetical protein